MAIDDHPVEVLRRHFELENASAMPFAGAILTAHQTLPASVTVSSRQVGWSPKGLTRSWSGGSTVGAALCPTSSSH